MCISAVILTIIKGTKMVTNTISSIVDRTRTTTTTSTTMATRTDTIQSSTICITLMVQILAGLTETTMMTVITQTTIIPTTGITTEAITIRGIMMDMDREVETKI